MVGFVFLNVIGGSRGPKRPRPLLLATQKKEGEKKKEKKKNWKKRGRKGKTQIKRQ